MIKNQAMRATDPSVFEETPAEQVEHIMKKHTFVVCAYGESPYLEECINSLKENEGSSDICIATHTDNNYIRDIANRFDIPVYINPDTPPEGISAIACDWNFGLSCVKTKYATIAHQDDIYDADYSRRFIEAMDRSDDSVIGFSDYYELHQETGVLTDSNLNLRIKKFMLMPLRINGGKKIRRFVLSFGDPICCPSVCYNIEYIKKYIKIPLFKDGMESCLDWQAWERLSRLDGEFRYVPYDLMTHRIHEASETTRIIGDRRRVVENYMMYRRFWPKYAAVFWNRLYTFAEKSNAK